ncbi:NAD(P)-binding protein [Hypoxylon sp. FL1284]|nr:NAD(P)-binding protein [Hypoxylon sp. FL1284]
MSKPWILVSPASRGIGHALARHLLRTTTAPVLATARTDLTGVRSSLLDSVSPPSSPSSSSRDDGASRRLHVVRLDVESESSVEAAAAEAARLFPPATHHLRLAFALPGVLRPEKSPRDVDYDAALRAFRVNALGPLMLMKWFGDMLPRRGVSLPLAREDTLFRDRSYASPCTVKEGEGEGEATQSGEADEPTHATWLTTTARVGSTTDNRLGGWYSYRSSKAAAASLTRTFDLHLAARSGGRALALGYHPGTVRTGLSREFWERVPADRLFSPEYAADRLLRVVRSRTTEHRGRCWDWKGEEVLP